MTKIALAIFLISVSSSLLASPLDAQTIGNALQKSTAAAASKNEFAIVYGGQDISRGNDFTTVKLVQPLLG